MRVYVRECPICGKTFEATQASSRYCSDECRREGNRISSRLRKQKATKSVVYPNRELIEMAKEASKRGLSYGEYVAKLSANRREAAELE